MGVKVKERNLLFDYLRSFSMAFVFLHHFYLTIPGNRDYFIYFNPFAEIFVGIAGFMVGYVYLSRDNNLHLLKRGLKIMLAYYIIAIPVELVYSEPKTFSEISAIIINSLLFLEPNHNWVGILVFYGVIFMLLPILLPIYKKNKVLIISLSVVIFIICLINPFREYILSLSDYTFIDFIMLVIQWQFFFFVGLILGDVYKNKIFNIKKIIPYLMVIGFIGVIIQIIWIHPEYLQKYPYTLEKFLNLCYIAPIILIILIYSYKFIKNSKFDEFIRVLGRNSLIAFILSEVLRMLILTLVTKEYIEVSELSSFVIAIFLSLFLLWVIKKYEIIKTRLS